MPKIYFPAFAFAERRTSLPGMAAKAACFSNLQSSRYVCRTVQWQGIFDAMNDNQLPKGMLRVASWWVTAVLVGYFVTNVLGSRTVQSMLGKW